MQHIGFKSRTEFLLIAKAYTYEENTKREEIPPYVSLVVVVAVVVVLVIDFRFGCIYCLGKCQINNNNNRRNLRGGKVSFLYIYMGCRCSIFYFSPFNIIDMETYAIILVGARAPIHRNLMHRIRGAKKRKTRNIEMLYHRIWNDEYNLI